MKSQIMPKSFLKDTKESYDVIVIGSGLGGLSGANILAKMGYTVLVLEHHYQLGGLATWFHRKGGHTFDVSLHGFPVGMIKSCKRYWTQAIAEKIRPLRGIRFTNPEFDFETSFDRKDFTRILNEVFKVPLKQIEAFFQHLKAMNYYDQDGRTTRELFEEFFPGQSAVHRLLLEPIAYANGSTFDDPAISYGIVFSNFMNSGAYIFEGGTNQLIQNMVDELEKNGVHLRKRCLVESILSEEINGQPVTRGVRVNGKEIYAKAVLSNANIRTTLFDLLGRDKLSPSFVEKTEAVRMNHSSCQVYMGLKPGKELPKQGELIFTSRAPQFSSDELLDFHTSSRTFSMYAPDTRPHAKEKRWNAVCSTNARWEDWAKLSDNDYAKHKERICEEAVSTLEKIMPGVRSKIEWLEAASPRTIHRYVRHPGGTSFGTKFEGLEVSMQIPEAVSGLYHAGSVGIIMSGWLGTMNYGIIAANKMHNYLISSN